MTTEITVNNQISHKHCNKWLQNFNKAKIYLIYNCSLTRHHRGETYRLLWTKLSHHLECVAGIVQPWPSYLKRLHSEQDVQIEFEDEKGMDGNGTATNDGTPVHSSKVSLNRRWKIWARPSSGEWQMYVFWHRTIPSALQHFFLPLWKIWVSFANVSICQCAALICLHVLSPHVELPPNAPFSMDMLIRKTYDKTIEDMYPILIQIHVCDCSKIWIALGPCCGTG